MSNKNMIFKSDALQKVKLVMFERTMLPESEMKKGIGGKKEFIKTGKEVEYTTYTFRDGAGDKLVLLSRENGYRSLEGKTVDIELDVKHNEFTKKTQTKLASVRESENLDL